MSWREVNPLAAFAVLSAAVFVLLGELDAREYLALVTGLAIPAGRNGYQSSGK